MSHADLPLFAWSPPACDVRAFPLDRRLGKVRDVARKLLTKATDKHAAQYRDQVEAALLHGLEKCGVPADRHGAELARFWRAVATEMARTRIKSA